MIEEILSLLPVIRFLFFFHISGENSKVMQVSEFWGVLIYRYRCRYLGIKRCLFKINLISINLRRNVDEL